MEVAEGHRMGAAAFSKILDTNVMSSTQKIGTSKDLIRIGNFHQA